MHLAYNGVSGGSHEYENQFFEFNKSQEISWLGEWLLVSEEDLWSLIWSLSITEGFIHELLIILNDWLILAISRLQKLLKLK
jgi:hypothetical protein